MTDEQDDGGSKPEGRSALPWIATILAAAAFGTGGFALSASGLTRLAGPAIAASAPDAPLFLELDPALIAVGGPGAVRQLRFRAFLEVSEADRARVPTLAPRILDICATYLRALDEGVLADPGALLRIRAQLLRRIQLLAGPDAVLDLLIVDFVIT